MADSTIRGTVVTGATGFVGGELVVKLLAQPDRHIICPVRASDPDAAQKRGDERLRTLVGPAMAERVKGRVTWFRADIEEPRLGMSPMQWHDLATRTHEIFHCAASVSFDLPLDQAERINSDGTKHIFELAVAAADRHPDFRRFHHVSTAYVAGITTGRVGPDFLPADRARNFRNTYERTKARAERFLRAQASVRVPVSIHRPSIIAGHRDTGRTTNWNVLYVPMRMAAKGQLPAFPRDGREVCDTVAVDYMVEAMVAFAEIDEGPLVAHHLTAGRTAFTVTELIERSCQRAALHGGYKPSDTRLLSRKQWMVLEAAVSGGARLPKSVGKARSIARIARRGLDNCKVYAPYTWVDVMFDDERDAEALRAFGIEMQAGPRYLETLLDYALANNFGRTPAEPLKLNVRPTSVSVAATIETAAA
jgi:long-chain acyl-CoA synthetase